MTDVEILQDCRMATLEERALSKQIDRLALICGPRGIGSQALEPAGDRKTNNATAGQLQQLEGLIEKLTQMTGREIRLKEQTDASLLGGVLLEMEGKRYDNTVRHRLRAIEQAMSGEA